MYMLSESEMCVRWEVPMLCRYHEWREIWQNENFPGEDNRNALRWQIRVRHSSSHCECVVCYHSNFQCCVGTNDASRSPLLCGKWIVTNIFFSPHKPDIHCILHVRTFGSPKRMVCVHEISTLLQLGNFLLFERCSDYECHCTLCIQTVVVYTCTYVCVYDYTASQTSSEGQQICGTHWQETTIFAMGD